MVNDFIYFNTHSGIKKADKKMILFVEAEGRYSKLVFCNGTSYVLAKGITELQTLLSADVFFRPHKHFLVNSEHILEFDKMTNSLVLSNQTKIQVATRRKTQIVNNFFQNKRSLQI